MKTYIADGDPNGTKIRVAPGKDSKILRRIKNDDVIDRVTGSSDGCFEISDDNREEQKFE